MRCAGRKKKTYSYAHIKGQNNQPGTYEKFKCCGKQATTFFRVVYEQLAYNKNSPKMFDSFGFCDQCAKGKDVPSGYMRNGWETNVHGLRGKVGSVEPTPEFDAKDEKRQRFLAIWISSFTRVMCQKNAQALSEDDWDFILEEAKKTACVTKVFES